MTRPEVSRYLAAELPKERSATITKVAAWLLSSGQRRRAGEISQEVARLLADEGYVLARITTARPLAESSRRAVEHYLKHELGAKHLELTEAVDPSLIGGIIIETPTQQLDQSLKSHLQRLVRETSQ